mmetsp:Transcript_97862/g.279888  ORF Transcript_97862/g.279888 Transcript_97862/m.279888 type:complete len:251 (-) Transcript_97862:1031-1783(-)
MLLPPTFLPPLPPAAESPSSREVDESTQTSRKSVEGARCANSGARKRLLQRAGWRSSCSISATKGEQSERFNGIVLPMDGSSGGSSPSAPSNDCDRDIERRKAGVAAMLNGVPSAESARCKSVFERRNSEWRFDVATTISVGVGSCGLRSPTPPIFTALAAAVSSPLRVVRVKEAWWCHKNDRPTGAFAGSSSVPPRESSFEEPGVVELDDDEAEAMAEEGPTLPLPLPCRWSVPPSLPWPAAPSSGLRQ